MDLEKAKVFAEEIACRAGKLLLEYSSKIKILEWKDRQDVATNADMESEKLILEAIEKEYPMHSILSEEKGEINKDSEYRWLVDPLDGTKEYVRGIPFYNVALSLRYHDEDVVAVVFRPAEGQLFSAYEGQGAFLNGKQIQVSEKDKLADAFVYSVLPFFTGDEENGFDRVWQNLPRLAKKAYRLRGAPDLNTTACWLAQGGCEALFNLLNPPKPWDIYPGLFIARQAGAQVSDLNGKPISKDLKNGLVVSNGKIHEKLLEVLNES